jgi:hypothetical protein
VEAEAKYSYKKLRVAYRRHKHHKKCCMAFCGASTQVPSCFIARVRNEEIVKENPAMSNQRNEVYSLTYQKGVPDKPFLFLLESPKSATLARNLESMRMFLALRSRWRIGGFEA